MLTLTASRPSLSMTTHLPRVYSVCSGVLLMLFETDVPEKFRKTGIPACPILKHWQTGISVLSGDSDRQQRLS